MSALPVPVGSPASRSLAVAQQIAKVFMDARFCAFEVKGQHKIPLDREGRNNTIRLGADDAVFWSASEILTGVSLPAGATYFGVSFYHPATDSAGRGLTLLDVDFKDHATAEDIEVANRVVTGATEAGVLSERSVSGRGVHLFHAETGELPCTLEIGPGTKIEVFAAGQDNRCILLTGNEMSGTVLPAPSAALLAKTEFQVTLRCELPVDGGGSGVALLAGSIVDPFAADDLAVALSVLDPAMGYEDGWFRVAMAMSRLQDPDGKVRQAFIDWSARSTNPNHGARGAAQKWDGLRRTRGRIMPATVFYMADQVDRSWRDRTPRAEVNVAALPEPSNLFVTAMPGPFPVRETLPKVLANWVEMQVQSTGLDAAGFAVSTLAALSGATHRSVRVKLGYHVSSCLIWSALLGDTGAGKSPCMELAIAPLKRIDARLNQDYAQQMEAYLAIPASQRGLKPARQMHVLADATIEAVVHKLSESDGHRVLRHVDEGSGWLNAMGRYAAAGKTDGERSQYLTGWLGHHNHPVSRIERGDVMVPEMGIAMLFGITPAKVKEGYVEASEEGLLARCLCVLLDRGKHAKPDRRAVFGTEASDYDALIQRLTRVRGEIVLSADALAVYDDWQSECRELAGALMHASPGLSAMLMKLAENTGRIAALYSLCGEQPDGYVHQSHMQQAIAMARALGSHAKILYQYVLSVGSAIELQRDLAETILRKNDKRIERRSLATARWLAADEGTRKAALDLLAADRWLLETDTKRVRSGTRFNEATAWIVNPLVLDGRFEAVRSASVARAEKALAALRRL